MYIYIIESPPPCTQHGFAPLCQDRKRRRAEQARGGPKACRKEVAPSGIKDAARQQSGSKVNLKRIPEGGTPERNEEAPSGSKDAPPSKSQKHRVNP